MKLNILNICISIFLILGILVIVSGYKTTFLPNGVEGFSNIQYPIISKKVKKDSNVCNPGFDCRRVGFYCSLIG